MLKKEKKVSKPTKVADKKTLKQKTTTKPHGKKSTIKNTAKTSAKEKKTKATKANKTAVQAVEQSHIASLSEEQNFLRDIILPYLKDTLSNKKVLLSTIIKNNNLDTMDIELHKSLIAVLNAESIEYDNDLDSLLINDIKTNKDDDKSNDSYRTISC